MGGELRVLLIVFGVIAAFVFVLAVFVRLRDRRRLSYRLEPYPPEGFTPADMGCVLDGRAGRREVFSLLLYWAQKGHIIIFSAFGKLVLIKLGGPPDRNDYELLLFNRLFEGAEEAVWKPREMKLHVSEAARRVRTKFERKENRLYKRLAQVMQDVVFMLSACPAAALAGAAVRREAGNSPLVLGAMAIFFFAGYALSIQYTRLTKARRYGKAVTWKQFAVWAAFAAAVYCGAAWAGFGVLGAWVWVAVTSALLLCMAAPFLEKRTEKGTQWLQKSLGLKAYMRTAKESELRSITEKIPDYFYRMLPYAYTFGIEGVWARKFENIIKEPPPWFEGGGDGFSVIMFVKHLADAMEGNTDRWKT